MKFKRGDIILINFKNDGRTRLILKVFKYKYLVNDLNETRSDYTLDRSYVDNSYKLITNIFRKMK